MDELKRAIDRPSVKNNTLRYIGIGAIIFGVCGVIICILASCWRLQKPNESPLWNRERLIEPNEEIIRNPQELERQVLSNQAVVSVMKTDAAFNDTDDEQDHVDDVLGVNAYHQL